MTATFKPDEEITKLVKSLEPNENDIDKISKVTHKCLMVMSVRDATIIMNNRNEKKENDDNDNDNDDKVNSLHKLIQEIYLKKIDILKEELLS